MADKQKMSYFHLGGRFAFLKKLIFGMYDFLFSFYDCLVNLRVLRKIYKATIPKM